MRQREEQEREYARVGAERAEEVGERDRESGKGVRAHMRGTQRARKRASARERKSEREREREREIASVAIESE